MLLIAQVIMEKLLAGSLVPGGITLRCKITTEELNRIEFKSNIGTRVLQNDQNKQRVTV